MPPKLPGNDEVRKKQRLVMFGLSGGFVLILVLGLYISDPNKGQPTPVERARQEAAKVERNFAQTSAITAEESWVIQSEGEIRELRQQNKMLSDNLTRMMEKLERMEEQQKRQMESRPQAPASALPPPPPPPAPAPQAQTGTSPAAAVAGRIVPPPPTAVSKSGEAGPAAGIQVVSLSDSRVGQEKDKTKNAATYLPAGSLATVVLLSGVDAPTGGAAQSNPVPVLLRLVDDGKLPNFFESEIRDCHVVGAAYGEISSERVHIRTETLSCVLLNGDIIEEQVQGYVAGEDGKAGLRGRLVEKQGQLLAKTFVAGMAGGAASTVQQQAQTVTPTAGGALITTDPNRLLQAGAAGGFSNSLEKLADYYMARANEMYPIIEVDARRIGEIVLVRGTEMHRNIQGNTRKEHP